MDVGKVEKIWADTLSYCHGAGDRADGRANGGEEGGFQAVSDGVQVGELLVDGGFGVILFRDRRISLGVDFLCGKWRRHIVRLISRLFEDYLTIMIGNNLR